MADTSTDLDTSLDNCPGCGKEIRWEHPRSRVRGIVWHAECLSSARADYQAGRRTTEQEREERMRHVREQATAHTGAQAESMRQFLDQLQRLSEKAQRARDNIDKMRRGRR